MNRLSKSGRNLKSSSGKTLEGDYDDDKTKADSGMRSASCKLSRSRAVFDKAVQWARHKQPAKRPPRHRHPARSSARRKIIPNVVYAEETYKIVTDVLEDRSSICR